jgi:hypothetical protein
VCCCGEGRWLHSSWERWDSPRSRKIAIRGRGRLEATETITCSVLRQNNGVGRVRARESVNRYVLGACVRARRY